MKILIFSAGDSRSKWLEESLEARGFEVVFSEPSGAKVNSDLVWNLENQEALLKKVKPQAVIFCPSIQFFNINALNNSTLILDLVSSTNLDQLIVDNANLPNYIVGALAMADRVIVDSNASRLYWYGWMLQAGKVPEGEHLALVAETGSALGQVFDYLGRKPAPDSYSKPVKGYVYTRPSFLAPIGTLQDFPLSERTGTISQDFIVPIDDLYSVVLPIRLASPESRAQILRLNIKIYDNNARMILEKILPANELPESGSVFINFSKLRPPKGGSTFTLKLNLEEVSEKSDTAPLLLKVYKESNYPLSEMSCDTNKCSGSLALSFHPNSCKVFLITRALKMLSRGEWRRFARAIRRRMAVA